MKRAKPWLSILCILTLLASLVPASLAAESYRSMEISCGASDDAHVMILSDARERSDLQITGYYDKDGNSVQIPAGSRIYTPKYLSDMDYRGDFWEHDGAAVFYYASITVSGGSAVVREMDSASPLGLGLGSLLALEHQDLPELNAYVYRCDHGFMFILYLDPADGFDPAPGLTSSEGPDTSTQQSTASGNHGSGSPSIPKLSREEITQLLRDNPFNLTDENIYDVEPSWSAPYSAGKVKDSVLQTALNRLNAMRKIAGVPSVVLDQSLCETAQYAALINAANNELSHTQKKPAGMDESFYQKAASSARNCSLAMGSTIVSCIDAFLEDSDASNINRLNHRSWQLNPTRTRIGFGAAGRYSAASHNDRSGSCSYDYISWPSSGNFPTDIFGKDYAWNVFLNTALYAAPVARNLTVTLTGDGKTWTFQGSQSYTAADSGKYFNYDGKSSGDSGYVIVFRPDGISDYEGTYNVSISGLQLLNGTPATLEYQVDFFNTGLPNTGRAQARRGISQSQGQSGTGQQQSSGTTTITPTTPASGTNPFTDVAAGSYYYDAVLWALENGVTTGVTATQFQPNSTCTRGQVVTFLWRAKGSPEPRTKTNPFSDVAGTSAFYKAILWAYENGITTGTDATHFNPGGTCTNGHVVTFLWRANGQPAASGSSPLAGTGKYYTGAVNWADGAGLLSGVGGTFNPSAQSPRANIVTYLYRDMAS